MESACEPSASVWFVLVTDLSFLVPPLIIKDIPQAFLELCKPDVEFSTQLEPKVKVKVNQTRLTNNYHCKQGVNTPPV